ncbi:SCO3242 family prenyltransferase [Streptomyces sp. BA2]|uniref:SCO3242 family prenyltransferase n=1 Tax=Streptomyces sp. BA2 TaxID=436595 RepID=UPI001F00B581|nr:UbiA family prenyltransferase [Streptomyces sp. BA2]
MGTGRDWAELLRVSALFTVPGDAIAGAAAAGLRPNRRTLLAIAASLSLYEAGMALNDWADREEDAVERPHRPLPSGRIAPAAALGAAAALTAGGLALAAAAGRPALTVATGLAATVWAYDLGLKHTPAGPAAMATARALDLLLGAAATAADSSSSASAKLATTRRPFTGPGLRAAVPTALVLGAHTLAVTAVSRREAQGGSTTAPLAALVATAGLAQLLARSGGVGAAAPQLPAGRGEAATRGLPGFTSAEQTGARLVGRAVGRLRTGGVPGGFASGRPGSAWRSGARGAVQAALAATYAATAARPLFHAALNPSPQLTQRAVGGGIRAMIPLQAALSARAGALGPALLTAALAPAARKFGRKVSVT